MFIINIITKILFKIRNILFYSFNYEYQYSYFIFFNELLYQCKSIIIIVFFWDMNIIRQIMQRQCLTLIGLNYYVQFNFLIKL